MLLVIFWDLIFINKFGKRFIVWVFGNCEKYLILWEYYNVFVLMFCIVFWILFFFVLCCIIFYVSVWIFWSVIYKCVCVYVLEYFRNFVDVYMKFVFIMIFIIVVYFFCFMLSMILYVFREDSLSFYFFVLYSIVKVVMSFCLVCYLVIFIVCNWKFFGYVWLFFVKKFRYMWWVYVLMCCRLLDYGLSMSNVYVCMLNFSYNLMFNIVRFYEVIMRLFRGKLVKLVFIDLYDF